MDRVTKTLGLYFLNGILVLLPVAGTAYLLVYLYQLVNSWGFYLLNVPMKWRVPGLGFLFVVSLVLGIGFIAKLWFTNKILQAVEGLIRRVPLVKGVYATLKETAHAFLGEKRSFDTVVLVKSDYGKRLGFLTVKDPVSFDGTPQGYLGVYFPHSLQVSGELVWVEPDRVERVKGLSVEEAFRLILSAGVAGGGRKNPHLPD